MYTKLYRRENNLVIAKAYGNMLLNRCPAVFNVVWNGIVSQTYESAGDELLFFVKAISYEYMEYVRQKTHSILFDAELYVFQRSH